jgi:hypothetical protein
VLQLKALVNVDAQTGQAKTIGGMCSARLEWAALGLPVQQNYSRRNSTAGSKQTHNHALFDVDLRDRLPPTAYKPAAMLDIR